jgi:serine/threonine-protein kinase
VELDDGLGEAHTALGGYLNFYEWDWAGAEREYRRAIALDPNFPTTYVWYQFMLNSAGRLDEALEAGTRARELDPLAPLMGTIRTLGLQGRTDLAMTEARAGVEHHPNSWLMYRSLGELLLETGRAEDAVHAFERAAALAGRTANARARLARALALAGRQRDARALIEELRAESAATDVYHPVVAAALAAVGDVEAAITWLQAAYRQRHPALVELNAEPGYVRLRRDPRFQDLVRRVGLRP